MLFNKLILMVLVCIVATFCVGCSDNNQEVAEFETVTSIEEFEEIEEIEPVKEIELTSIFTNEDAHTLYHELIEYLTDGIRWNVENKLVLEISEESKNELQKLQENKFYNVSYLKDYMINRIGFFGDFNYAFLDIDNNGIDEFFLLEDERLVEFFHIVDGEIERVIASSGYKIYTQLRNNLTFYEYIDGTQREYYYNMFEFNDNELILTNCFVVRNYSQLDGLSEFNFPAVDGKILFLAESQSSSFIEHEAFNEYLLDEQEAQEFKSMLYDRYEFETVYPINYD